MVSLSIMLHRLSKSYAPFTKQITHNFSLLPENGTFCLASQKFKCDTIILVTEIESSKRSSKPYTLLLAMFWSLNLYPTRKKCVNWVKSSGSVKKTRCKNNRMAIWPRKVIEYIVIKVTCEVWVFESITVELQSEKQKKGHLNQWNFFTQFFLPNQPT